MVCRVALFAFVLEAAVVSSGAVTFLEIDAQVFDAGIGVGSVLRTVRAASFLTIGAKRVLPCPGRDRVDHRLQAAL